MRIPEGKVVLLCGASAVATRFEGKSSCSYKREQVRLDGCFLGYCTPILPGPAVKSCYISLKRCGSSLCRRGIDAEKSHHCSNQHVQLTCIGRAMSQGIQLYEEVEIFSDLFNCKVQTMFTRTTVALRGFRYFIRIATALGTFDFGESSYGRTESPPSAAFWR